MLRFNTVTKFTVGLVMLASFITAASAADSATDEAAIRSLNQTWIKSYNSGDAKAMVNLYAENAVLMAPGAATVSGVPAIRAYLAKDIESVKKAGLVFSVTGKTDVGVSGDMAWESGTYMAKDKAGAIADTGKFLSVFRKKDGKWLFLRDMWNSDAATESAPASTPAKK